jgi:ABC-type transporter MlaC component
MSTNKRVKETFDKLGKDLVITKQSCDTKKMLEDIKNRIEIKKTVGEILDTLIEGSIMVDTWWTDLTDEQEQEIYDKLEEIITRRFGNIKFMKI